MTHKTRTARRLARLGAQDQTDRYTRRARRVARAADIASSVRRKDGVTMGAYCMFCDHRCFVYRQVVVGGIVLWSGHMATCGRGREHDRRILGMDSAEAHNPHKSSSAQA